MNVHNLKLHRPVEHSKNEKYGSVWKVIFVDSRKFIKIRSKNFFGFLSTPRCFVFHGFTSAVLCFLWNIISSFSWLKILTENFSFQPKAFALNYTLPMLPRRKYQRKHEQSTSLCRRPKGNENVSRNLNELSIHWWNQIILLVSAWSISLIFINRFIIYGNNIELLANESLLVSLE